MAWKRIPDPYDKYITPADPQYSSGDIRGLMATDAEPGAISIFSQWANAGAPLAGKFNPAPPAGSGFGGGTIDYRSLIDNDPYYKQAKADMSAQSISDAAQRAAAIKRTLIDWGVIPDFAAAGDKLGLSSTALGFLTSDVDERTRQLAGENEAQGLSVHARLGKANEDNIRMIRNALAARGMYESGELGFGLTENAQQYKQASTDAEKQVLGGLEEVSGRFVQAERDRQRALATEMMNAAQRASLGGYGSGGSGGGGGGNFQWDPQVAGQLSNGYAGYGSDQIGSIVAGVIAERGWGPYMGPGGLEAPRILEIVNTGNGYAVRVKVGTPTGNSTETIPLPAPVAAPTQPTITNQVAAPTTAPSTSGITPYYAPRPTRYTQE